MSQGKGGKSRSARNARKLESSGQPAFASDAPVLNAIISPFIFPEFFNPSNGANLGVLENVTQNGTLTITYEYSIIPAPGAGVLMLGGLGLLARRRRA